MQQLVHGERMARAVRLQRAAADKAAAEARSERLAAGGAASQGAPCLKSHRLMQLTSPDVRTGVYKQRRKGVFTNMHKKTRPPCRGPCSSPMLHA